MNIYAYVLIGMISSFLLVIAMVLLFVRYKKNMLRQQYRLQTAELNHQKQLTKVIIESQENERKQIGKELHDDVGNALASLRLFLDEHMMQYVQADVKEAYKKRINAIFHKVRTISHQLSIVEIELFGLREAIFILAENTTVKGAFNVQVEERDCRIPDDMEYTTSVIIYRVLQELLTNTMKHARADNVNISIECFGEKDELIINYNDNGTGLSSKKMLKGMGFKNIESRLQIANGRFEFVNAEQQGFHVAIYIPLLSNANFKN
jgi:signal transduction histidine kinase